MRGILTFLVISCLFTSIIGIYLHLKSHKITKNFRKIIILETLGICAICLIQAILDRLGVGRDFTLLCRGCISETFGFSHPNGLAIEPQFMGSLLIAPLFLAFNSLLENKNKKSQISAAIATFLITTTLFFTFSRGTIYAAIIGILYLIIKNKSTKKAIETLGNNIISFSASLGIQVALSTTQPSETVNTVLSQLSLGKINLESESDKQNESNSELNEPTIELVKKPVFDGYIAESTDRRLELSTYAIKISTENPSNLLFGTGLGSTGTELYNHFPEKQGHKKEIVQNQYFETILEIGIIGVIALVLTLITFVKIEKLKFDTYTKATCLAFMITIIFFSGFPNALHVYLLPVLWYNLMYDKNSFSRV
jgi:O-antigen ligase